LSRIQQTFNDLATQGKKALIAYIMAGDPDLSATEEIVFEMEKAGVDMIELGVPFSDPVADGPTIQKASERALAKGVTLKSVINTVSALRKQTKMPILLMTYLNPIHAMGVELFFKKGRAAGIDGVIIPDLPLEEAKPYLALSRQYRIDLIFLIAPTTPPSRMKKIVKEASGFIYYVALTGITGAKISDIVSVTEQIQKIKTMTKIPVAVGFGVTAENIGEVACSADGAIVGSELVKIIASAGDDPAYLSKLSHRITQLKEAL
jgi:tryptophan synthase alpha chain